jgi:hypothetical protein
MIAALMIFLPPISLGVEGHSLVNDAPDHTREMFFLPGVAPPPSLLAFPGKLGMKGLLP